MRVSEQAAHFQAGDEIAVIFVRHVTDSELLLDCQFPPC